MAFAKLSRDQRSKLSAQRKRQRIAYMERLTADFDQLALKYIIKGGSHTEIRSQSSIYMTRRRPSVAERRGIIERLLEACPQEREGQESAQLKRVREIAEGISLDQRKFAPILRRWRARSGANTGSSARDGSRLKAKPRAARIPKCYRLLECTPDSSDQEIKRAYRRLATTLHPDKHSAQGVSDEKLKLYTKAFQELLAAYEEVCRLRAES